MDKKHLVFSSVTYALKAMSSLTEKGIRSRLEKMKDIPSLGSCGYVLVVSAIDLENAVETVNSNGIKILAIFDGKN